MSDKLVKSFFERDLDAFEMKQLSRHLESGPAPAARFDALAAAHYRSLGLPEPRLRHAGPGAFGIKGLLLAFTAGGALASALWFAKRPASPPLAIALQTPLSMPAPKPVTISTRPIPKLKPAGFEEGEELGISVSLPQSTNLAVDVFDSKGRRIKRLFEGERPAGEQKFSFDGKDSKGMTVAAGKYKVTVDWGGGVMEKWITISE